MRKINQEKKVKGKYAYVTFIMRNDSYIPGALVLAYRLLKQCTKADLVCLVTPEVSDKAKAALSLLYNYIVEINEIYVRHQRNHERQDRSYLFTRFQALRLGEDGGLGFDYEKIVVLDADIMPLSRYDKLFELDTPAGIINERKDHCIERGDYKRTDGKWIWHDIYEDICKHGEAIPSEITDKVISDPSNMGVNASIWVLTPDKKEFDQIIKVIQKPAVVERISSFNWPEMQFATYYWSGRWHNIDLRYSTFNSQPSLELVYGTHFAGLKPWSKRKKKSIKHYFKYDDYRMWYREYAELIKWVFPSLQSVPKLRSLLEFYEKELITLSSHLSATDIKENMW